MAKEKRFVVASREEKLASGTKIIVDSKTGVNYLFYRDGNAGGLCALVDADGKPIVTNVSGDLEG